MSENLALVQLDEDTYTMHAEGIGAVYWIHRSEQWGGMWQAFTMPDRRPVPPETPATGGSI